MTRDPGTGLAARFIVRVSTIMVSYEIQRLRVRSVVEDGAKVVGDRRMKQLLS